MDKTFQKFLRTGVDLSPLGFELRADAAPYFCTPKGARILGWAGVDGIHYCTVRGSGSRIFAVSPMNAAPEYVHPIAENFEDFLRLLLACGDAAALEQSWQWDEAQFSAFLNENPPTAEQKAALSELSRRMQLTPMPEPWRYLHALQADFAPAEKPSPKPARREAFDCDLLLSPRSRGRFREELALEKSFDWIGRHWLVPAAYVCGKGLAIDFCMRVEADELRAFMQKWKLSPENDDCAAFSPEDQLLLDAENPLALSFTPALTVNGRTLNVSESASASFHPCFPDRETPLAPLMRRYHLSDAFGWVVTCAWFPWSGRRPAAIHSIELSLRRTPATLPGPHFTVHAPGDAFRFTHPYTGTEHTLTAQSLEARTLPEPAFGRDFPTHFTLLRYALDPEPAEPVLISDTRESDRPVRPEAIEGSPSVSVIGGADGPTALFVSGGAHTACSALRFSPDARDIEWRATFEASPRDDFSLSLL
ncbi:MAG: hypothetical protein Q4E18_11700 [Clostridia bacterium]|nr:hypothetical protein [Clostridia bacterium]